MDSSMAHGDMTAVYSDARWRPIICALFLAALMVQSILTGQRTPMRWSRLRRMEATTVAIMLTLHSSLGFILMSSFVTLGLGTSRSEAVCSLANYTCIFFYSSSKLFTSWFLVERARLVHSPHQTRRENRLYQFNLSLLLLWVGIFIAMLFEHHNFIRSSDGQCKIGLNPIPVYSVVGVDFVLSSYLTLLFAYPVVAIAHRSNSALRNLAIRSALAGMLCLCSTVTNLVMLIYHDGMELSWVCLASCTLDTTWCAIVLVALTNKRERGELKAQAASSGGKITLNYLGRTGSRGVEVTVDECKVTSGPACDELDEDDCSHEVREETKHDSLGVPPVEYHAHHRPVSVVSQLAAIKKQESSLPTTTTAGGAGATRDDPALWRADHNQLARTATTGAASNNSFNSYADTYGW